MNEPPSPTPRLAVARIGPATARGTVGSCCVHTPGAAEVEQIFSASTSFSGLSQTILDRTGQAIRDLSGRHLALFGCRVVIVVILGVVGDGQLVEHLVEITDGRGRRTAVRGLGGVVPAAFAVCAIGPQTAQMGSSLPLLMWASQAS